MVLIRKTICIYKMSAKAAKLDCTFIHHLSKIFDAPTRDKFSDAPCNFICGFQHHTIEGILHRDLFTFIQTDMAGSSINAEDGIV